MKELLHVLFIAVIIILGFGCGAAVYIIYIVWRGYSLIRTAPRADMWICEKGHGPMPKNALIKFMNQDFCPICFHKRLSEAERGRATGIM